jgi:hypothetical protein
VLLGAAAVWGLATAQPARAQLIVSVTDANGDPPLPNYAGLYASQRENDSGYPNAVPAVAPSIVPFGDRVFCYTDRTHQYVGARFDAATGALTTGGGTILGVPPYLIGGEYVATRNDNKDNAAFQMSVVLGQQDVTAYLLIDNRAGPTGGDQDALTPPALGNGFMDWVLNDGWAQVSTGYSPNGPNGPQPDYAGIDEGGGLNNDFNTRATNTANLGDLQNFFTVYKKEFAAGATITTYECVHGGNMYGLVVVPRPAPPVCALIMSPAASTAQTLAGSGDPPGSVITFRGYGDGTVSYTATELDAGQNVANVPWMSLSKTQGPSLAHGQTDTLTVNYDTTDLTPGNYTAYVRVTDTCNPARSQLHTVNLTIGNPALVITSVSITGSDAPISGGVQAQRENDRDGVIVPFGEDVFCFTDRTHEYNGARYNSATGVLSTTGDVIVGLPVYLLGGEYVSTMNGNRDNGNPPDPQFRINVTINPTLTRGVWAYLLIDNRVGGGTADPPTLGSNGTGLMAWVADDGWTQYSTGLFPNGQPDYVGIDEGGTPANWAARTHLTTVGPGQGLNQFSTVYRKGFNPGDTIVLKEQEAGGINMYGLVVVPRIPCTLDVPGSLIATGNQGGPNPPDATVTIRNSGDDGIPTSYTVAELDENQNGADIPWLSTDKTGGGPIAGGATDTLIVKYNTAGVPRGDYTAYLRITDDCTPNKAKLIRVTLVVRPPDLRIPQRLAPNGLYVQAVGSMTWDEARVHYNTNYRNNPPVFHGAAGDWKKITDLLTGSIVGSLGEIWLPGTDANVISTLDGTDLGATLGSLEGTFKWLDGTAVPAGLWGTGEPNNEAGGQSGDNPGEDAMNLRGDGRYNDHKGGPSIGQPTVNLPYFLLYEGVDLSGQGKVRVLGRRPVLTPANPTLDSLQEAIDLMNLPKGDAGIAFEASATYYAVSFGDPGAASGGAGSRGGWLDWPKMPFVTDTVDFDDDDFAVQVTGFVVIPEAGTYTFVLVHDDFARLSLGTCPGPDCQTLITPAATGAHALVATFAAPGDVPLEIIHQERGGGSYLQLFATRGNDTDAVARNFHEPFILVGDVYGGGLAVKPPLDPCGKVFADRDNDGDVDLADYGRFQECITGANRGPVAPNCTCFDRDGPQLLGDNDVDEIDLQAFDDCMTGPGINWSKAIAPDCVPERP